MVVLKDCPVRPPVEREGMRDEPVGAELAGAVPGKIEVLGAVAAVPGVPGVPVVGAEPGVVVVPGEVTAVPGAEMGVPEGVKADKDTKSVPVIVPAVPGEDVAVPGGAMPEAEGGAAGP